MPRATRSKIVIAEDDTAIASQVPLPATPRQARPALTEISNNLEEVTMTVEEAEMAAQLKSLKAAYKTAIGGKKNKKGKAKKKFKEQLDLNVIISSQEVVDDEEPVAASSATEEARQMLSSEEEETPSAKKGRNTPPSLAVRETRQQLQTMAGIGEKVNKNRGRDAEEIKLPMKADINTLEAVDKPYERQENVARLLKEAEEDSFIEKITNRSPAKPVARIEDSIETIDKLEEAIEALGQATVAVSPRSVAYAPDKVLDANTQARATKTAAKQFSSLRAKPRDTKRNIKTMDDDGGKVRDVKKSNTSSVIRDAIEASNGKVAITKNQVKRPASLLPPKESIKSTRPVTRPNFELPGEIVARRLKEQREARKAQQESTKGSPSNGGATTPAPRVKSAKPVTKPFELPGESLSRKKREAREARLKAEEEEEKKRRQFKARPVRNSVQPDFVPRETVASRARKSQVGVPESDGGMKGQACGTLSVGNRTSIVGAHRPSMLATTLANTSAPRAPGPPVLSHPRKVSTPSGPSMSGLAMQRMVSASEVQLQRRRAKEIYNRDMKALEEMEKEKREREAAAKKSRLEAAERGRQASREWAEKQRAKKVIEEDKNLCPNVGPVGQLD